MKKSSETTVEKLLDETPRPGRRGAIAGMPELAAAIKHFMALKAAGDSRATMSLTWFYQKKLRDHFGGPRCASVARKFVMDELGLDPNTGKSLR
jgi:hypothetical protein